MFFDVESELTISELWKLLRMMMVIATISRMPCGCCHMDRSDLQQSFPTLIREYIMTMTLFHVRCRYN